MVRPCSFLPTYLSSNVQTVFPSSYRSDTVTESKDVKVDEQVNLSTLRTGREGHDTRYASVSRGPRKTTRYEEDIRVYEEDKPRRPIHREENIRVYEEDRDVDRRNTRVEIQRDR